METNLTAPNVSQSAHICSETQTMKQSCDMIHIRFRAVIVKQSYLFTSILPQNSPIFCRQLDLASLFRSSNKNDYDHDTGIYHTTGNIHHIAAVLKYYIATELTSPGAPWKWRRFPWTWHKLVWKLTKKIKLNKKRNISQNWTTLNISIWIFSNIWYNQ